MISFFNSIKKNGLFIAGSAFFLCVFFKNAWVADDAYIAFRSVEQLFAGNGLRWNFDERVQVYTSPLWFLLLSFSRVFISDLFVGSILLSALCCIGFLFIAYKTIDDNKRWLLFVLLVSGAWAVMDFSSSGLENPLLYFLTSIYLWCYSQFFLSQNQDRQKYFLQGFLLSVGLLAVTRHDVATLVFIPSLYFFYHAWKSLGFKFLLKNSYLLWLPLFGWTLFSVIYYGMPFPNTAYAKILHGVPRRELIDFGLSYLYASLRWDYFTQISVLFLIGGSAYGILAKRSLPLFFVLLGVLLNGFYIVYVGGDFMQGRFISVPIFTAALAACIFVALKTRAVIVFGSFLLAVMFFSGSPLKLAPNSGFDINEGKRHFSWNGILNERNFYFKTNSLWAYRHRDNTQPFPNHKWCLMGKRASENGKKVSDFGGIGMYGYCASLDLIVIDKLALGEPFLARLPMMPNYHWRAGHFRRAYPQGYYQSRVSGVNELTEPHLAELWKDIALLSREPLFTKERWQAIWRINSGFYGVNSKGNIAPYYFSDITD